MKKNNNDKLIWKEKYHQVKDKKTRLKRLAEEVIDYTKTDKKIYLDENNQPIYKDILGDLLCHAEEVKREAETEEFFREPEVGHMMGGQTTEGVIVTRVSLSKVLVENYEDNLDGFYDYIQSDEADEIVKEDFEYWVECEGDEEMEDFSTYIKWNEQTNVIEFECNYTCGISDYR